METIITIASLVIAVLAVIVGPVISARASRKAMLGQMRQEWIRELRNLLSKILTEAHAYLLLSENNRERPADVLLVNNSLSLMVRKLSFMLNLNKETHNQLYSAASNIMNAALNAERDDYTLACNELEDRGRAIIKAEWNIVKEY